MTGHRPEPLPLTGTEVSASRAEPWPPGVMMVRMDRRAVGLHVHPGGIALLRSRDWPWEPQPAITKVSRRLLRSKVRLRFADGTKAVVRPYKPGLKGLIEAGQPDTLWGGSSATRGANDDVDGILAVLLILAAVVLFVPLLVMLGREVFGTSARAKQATVLVSQLRALPPAS